MTSVDEVRPALAAALASIDGLNCHSTGYIRSQVNPPEAMVDYSVAYHQTFGPDGASQFAWRVTIYDRLAAEADTQKRFDRWRSAGPDGVKYALENDVGLAAVCNYVSVNSCDEPVAVAQIGQIDYLTISFDVEVM